MYKGILSTIGNTPLVKLERIFKGARFNFFAKLEYFNPGGSIKDRSALNMISDALESGRINKDTVVIESSSGNLGIGLAQACSFFGLRFICVVDSKTTRHVVGLLKAYGAEVVVVNEPDPATGEFLPARIKRVKDLLNSTPNAFWCNQYANLANPAAHHRTMQEICESLDGRVDYLFCATSTCGTLRGCSEYAKANGVRVRIIAVDARGSVLFDRNRRTRLIPGHGISILPEIFKPGLQDEYILVSDSDCIKGCRRLLQAEAILAGGSAGGVISAIEKKAAEIEEASNCVAILADGGERYLDTIYSDSWVSEHFGNLLEYEIF